MHHRHCIFRGTGLFSGVLLLAACATGPVDPETSSFYNIPAGATLVLNADITIPADRVSVYIQNGAVMNFRDIEKYYPYCKFEIRTMQDISRVVKADSFIVYRSEKEETIVNYSHSPLRRVGMDNGGPSFIEMFRTMYLRSEQQPDVLRISCGHRAVSPHYDHLTVSEVRKTLGNLLTLHLPAK